MAELLRKLISRYQPDHEALKQAIISEDCGEIRKRMKGKGCVAVTTVRILNVEIHAAHFAAFQGAIQSLRTISELGFPIDPTGSMPDEEFVYSGFRAGHFAAFMENVPMLSYLASMNIGLDKTTNDSWHTPLHIAVENGSGEAARFLVEHGVNVNAESASGYTPLMLAAKAGRRGFVSHLLDNGANIDQRHPLLGSALSVAIDHVQTSVIGDLLEAGANPENRDLELADNYPYRELKDLIKAHMSHRQLEESTSDIALSPKRTALRI